MTVPFHRAYRGAGFCGAAAFRLAQDVGILAVVFDRAEAVPAPDRHSTDVITGVSGGAVSTTKLTLFRNDRALRSAASTAMTVITWLPVARGIRRSASYRYCRRNLPAACRYRRDE